jgi:hypothetical protein
MVAITTILIQRLLGSGRPAEHIRNIGLAGDAQARAAHAWARDGDVWARDGTRGRGRRRQAGVRAVRAGSTAPSAGQRTEAEASTVKLSEAKGSWVKLALAE